MSHQPRLFDTGPDQRPQFDFTLPDVCANKHGGNENSAAAYADTPQRKRDADRETIIGLARAAGPEGITCEEACDAMKTTPNVISGRFSELVRDGVLKRDGKRRTRSGCWAAVHVSHQAPKAGE